MATAPDVNALSPGEIMCEQPSDQSVELITTTSPATMTTELLQPVGQTDGSNEAEDDR
jgi:hypothetical protein